MTKEVAPQPERGPPEPSISINESLWYKEKIRSLELNVTALTNKLTLSKQEVTKLENKIYQDRDGLLDTENRKDALLKAMMQLEEVRKARDEA